MGVFIVDTSNSPYARLRPVSISNVKVNDNFWLPRLNTLARVTLPRMYNLLEETGRVDNFRRVSGDFKGGFRGLLFNDSDVYKWIEATAWLLTYMHSDELAKMLNDVVDAVSKAQLPDGYINTYFYDRLSNRYRYLRQSHELYCAGHLIQAAIACRRGGACQRLYDTAVKLANHIVDNFNDHGIVAVDGHPEVEMALIELYRESGDVRYLNEAVFQVNTRGRGTLRGFGMPNAWDFDDEYFIDHKPIKELNEVPIAHAVRFLYLMSGTTDVFMETGDKGLWDALNRLWVDLTETRMYITGGVGSRHEGESIGERYELPNDRAYSETCAAVANIMWNYRMLLATGEAKYADVMELALYNAALAGVSLDGREFFYVNPLASRGYHRRMPWFEVACCPPNIARLLASLPGYIYSLSSDGLWVHLYVSSSVRARLGNNVVELIVKTSYPWDGEVNMVVNPSHSDEFTLYLRIPGWSRGAKLMINGGDYEHELTPSTYVGVRRSWSYGDEVTLRIPMNVDLMSSHQHVLANTSRVAIRRGPLIYCIEQTDNPGVDVYNIALKTTCRLEARFNSELLGGVVIIEGDAYELGTQGRLYESINDVKLAIRPIKFKAIPYYAWANREPGPMTVWVPLMDYYDKVVKNQLSLR
ncbi:MAG: glycoside hydrolase family 127 protein [Caldivirga sp.]